MARYPVTLVELDLPYCARTYGVSPCTAALSADNPRKCFNCLSTCQDKAAYSRVTKTVTFAHNIVGNPDVSGLFPCLQSVSSRSGELNLSGIDPSSTSLGSRAKVTVTLADFPSNDTWLDKYQSERVSGAAQFDGIGYKPEERGLFLRRMLSRFPYYVGNELRVRRGQVGQAPEDMDTEYYFVDTASGPDTGGTLTLTAKDVIDLVDNDKAVFPALSTGKLLSAITASATAATLTPSGIGDSEYPASGLALIGSEIVYFERSGDTLSLGRGQELSTAAAHSASDAVQVVGEVAAQPLYSAIAFLLDAGGIDAGFIPIADWQANDEIWNGGIGIKRTLIPKPVGIKTLVGEICQLGALVWPASSGKRIEYKVNAPRLPDQTPIRLSEAENIIAGSGAVTRADDARISALTIYHGVRSWTGTMTDGSNYSKASIAAVSENPYEQEALVEIATRWLGAEGDTVIADIIAARLLSRYSITPKVFSGSLDVKDRPQIALGALVDIDTVLLQGPDGANTPEPMQIKTAKYLDAQIDFEAESYSLDGNFGFYMDADTDELDYNAATPEQRANGAFYADADAPDATDSVYF